MRAKKLNHDRDAFLAGCRQLEIKLTDEQLAQLDAYVELLLKWNRAYNLIAPSTVNNIYTRHLLDSIQLLPYINSKQKILDIGSGAGLPAAVLAIMSDNEFYCCEINNKKAQFLKQVARSLNIQEKLKVINSDVRLISEYENSFDVVSARAFAELKDIVTLGKPYLNEGGVFILPKGTSFNEEIISLNDIFEMTISIHPSITNKEAKILVLH